MSEVDFTYIYTFKCVELTTLIQAQKPDQAAIEKLRSEIKQLEIRLRDEREAKG